ncbi:uncharacterized protein N7496_007572, partial [Penicillium cataractarum]
MEFTTEAILKPLRQRGFVQGTKYSINGIPTCLSFTGVRYALPSKRWTRAKPLSSSFTYGTRENPGQCASVSAVCPQMEWDGTFNEASWSEDCFQTNIWMPNEDPPEEGWPVMVFLHGGWLQSGTPNEFKPASLIGEGGLKAVIVLPAYRLGVFGFLYCAQLEEEANANLNSTGNLGFWDQRLALEWVSENISLFGGDANNITLAGYSAGAYSAFHQLAYELNTPTRCIIKRLCMWSNGPGVQPKSPSEAQVQFDQLVTALNIPNTFSSTETLAKLRSLSSKEILQRALSIPAHQFRPTTDGAFITPNVITNLGTLAQTLVERKIPLMIGECRDEHVLYEMWRPPAKNTWEGLRDRLIAEYPEHIANGLMEIYFPNRELPSKFEDWKHAFGFLYADMQVHRLGRGLVKTVAHHGGEELLYRYRIEYRMKCVDSFLPAELGVTHGTDQAIWFWGGGRAIPEEEKLVIKRALVGPLHDFVAGKHVDWGTSDCRTIRKLTSTGEVEIWKDALWEEHDPVWNL